MTKGLHYLHGSTNYGDAVEDEWLIVYMLRRLTESHPSLWVRVTDIDGEFLLVEAASMLPNWLSPEVDENRVWIHDANLLIIPPKSTPGQRPGSRSISLGQAISFIKSEPRSLIHSPLIEAEAFYRLEKYPEQITESVHHCTITVPRRVAHVLHLIPRAVAPAVEAFYLRDALSLKPVMAAPGQQFFPPDDLVTTSVRFSKVLFAQLKSQRFQPPPFWENAMRLSSESGGSQARIDLGMKLSCGFEMLAVGADKSKSKIVRRVGLIINDMKEDGDLSLPTNEEMASWPDHGRDDDEAWMYIDYEDFERELNGRRGNHGHEGDSSGFGSASAQADLGKIVSRFESFLNDDKAGLDGAELYDANGMEDDENDSDEVQESDFSEGEGDLEDKEVSFDEEAFTRMMREMMGLPACGPHSAHGTGDESQQPALAMQGSVRDEDEASIKQLSSQMEAELKKHGALKADAAPGSRHALTGSSNDANQGRQVEQATYDHDDDEDVDIDYNLARNLLESFKSQAGMAGPTGNLLGLMGLQLPRDEADGAGGNS